MITKNRMCLKTKKLNSLLITILCTCLLALGFLFYQGVLIERANAEMSSNIVISEVQLSGSSANDEFIELYNPTPNPIDLQTLPLKLHIRSSSGTDQNRTLTFNNTTIQAYGFYLIAPVSTAYSAQADATYSTSGNMLVANGSVYISNDSIKDIGIVDMLGFGTQPLGGFETSPYDSNPLNNQSVERKSNGSSTPESMQSGGVDELKGNAWDTDNNSLDFVLRTIAQPQNSQNQIENYNSTILNNIQNPSFEIDEDADSIPDSWTVNNFTSEDGKNADYAKESNYSLKITGDITKAKYVRQRLQVSGFAGELITLSGWNKTTGATSNGKCIRVFVYFNNLDGTRTYKSIVFDKDTHDWTNRSITFTAGKNYSSIDIIAGYFYQTGTTYFDDLKLIRNL